jgi:short-subunit dehydrogenase
MLSSMSGKAPTPYNAVYAAAKHGINGFAGSMSFELEGTGVHIGVVCPGFVAGAGMWADAGVKAPALMREVPVQKVVDGVRRVIAGEKEVLVTPGPVRPLLALSDLAPSWIAPMLRALGVVDVLRRRADVVRSRR